VGIHPVAVDLTLTKDKEIGLYTKGTIQKKANRVNNERITANPNIYNHTKARDTFILTLNSVCYTALKTRSLHIKSFPFKPQLMPRCLYVLPYSLSESV
jgi:hypothetical protein